MPVAPARPALAARVLRPFQAFVRAGAQGGVLLLACTAVALAWANGPWAAGYRHLWEVPVSVGPAAAPLTLSLHAWINDALMAVFFLLVGLEIKREFLVGELATARQAALPVLAALGGMVVPAALYALVNRGGPGAAGWGIPMATDIAFALGILALLGPRVPAALKVFLAALAIADDLGAVLVIALFYSGTLDAAALGAAAACLLALGALNRRGVGALAPYLLVGAVLWYAVLRSGVHASVAGVLLAWTIPATARLGAPDFSARARALLDEFDRADTGDARVITSRGQQEALHGLDVAASAVNAPLLRLEHVLNPVVQYGVMPLFALANAGVPLDGVGAALRTPVALGIVLGLALGKVTGILGATWLALRTGIAVRPAGVGMGALHGAAWLGGIGFTMSLFIAGLAFADAAALTAAKAAILLASTGAGAVGFVVLRRALPRA